MTRRLSTIPFPSLSLMMYSRPSFLPARVLNAKSDVHFAPIQTTDLMQTIDLRDNDDVVSQSATPHGDNQSADAQDVVATSNEDDDDSVTVFEVEVDQDQQQLQEAKIGFVKLLRAFLLKKNDIVLFK